MKKVISFYCIILTLICQVFTLGAPVGAATASAASANNFYFSDAKFDYTLEKDTEGVSILKVKETLTAEFPNRNQNHGITRYIPRTNQAGKNVTVASRSALNLRVTRNGAKEPIGKTEEENGAYIFYIGDADKYVQGTQIYVLEYEFKNVVTNFDNFQELYWDTNGTGWSQKFENLTATLHFADQETAKNLLPDAWCYVGRYGDKGKDRCTISKSGDGLAFTTSNLRAGENLTFVAQFKPGTFTVAHYYNYGLVILSVVATIICGAIVFLSLLYWKKRGAKKYAFRKHLLLAPEYVAPKNLTVAEAEQILLKSTNRSSYVATLLELIVSKKVEILKGEPTGILKKDTWKVKVVNTNGLTESQECMLKILNGGAAISDGLIIDVKKHSASSTLLALGKKYRSSATTSLKRRKLLEEKAKSSSSSSSMAAIIAAVICFMVPLCAVFGIVISDLFVGDVVGKDFLWPYLIILFPASIILAIVFLARTLRYSTRTEAGLEMDNYLEGLKLYIKMAEKERLEFNQSVKGAPTTAAGMVKLYEKLLPYACLFGLEESWMNTLDKYYQDNDLARPDWYTYSLINYSMFHSFSQNFNTVVVSSSSVSSSGSSGGGGGGFSGGGGGGGGGGGW